ncbi:MAG: histidine kinase [Dorea sp.]|jgi:two-component system sensor histidine kinase YesM|nr:histidine kinase [Dorea sp.]MCI9226690.1 histidine kinase [Dorea sp.]
MRYRDGRERPFVSLFIKSVAVLILIGILPLLVMGIAIYNAYAESIKENLLSNMYRITLSVGRGVEGIYGDMVDNTNYLYEYRITGYDYFYELMEDDSIQEKRRTVMMSGILESILYRNPYIDHVFFITVDGRQYSVVRSSEAVLAAEAAARWNGQYYDRELKQPQLIPTHLTDYYYYPQRLDFTVARNIRNTKTIQSADEEVIGTLYIDVNIKALSDVVNETELNEGSEMYIVDRKEKVYVYHPDSGKTNQTLGKLEGYLPEMDENYQYVIADGMYYIYSYIEGTDWMVIHKIPRYNLENSYREIRSNTILIICISVILLLILYYFYSKKTNKPILQLKTAMEKVQNGELDTRVEVYSNDEIGFLARGMNQMTENLQGHIKKVYIAEIRQREAEIETLKTQIQPHYLYNTLDVIRMTAVMNDDFQTAGLLDGLSGQLKYLIGGAREIVTLRDEIENVENYFKIVRVRYENRFDLEVNVDEELLSLRVPQLILQPVVENSVKYGLRPKEESGIIAVNVQIEGERLLISIMDNGQGMTPQRLSEVREVLENKETVKHPRSKKASIGLKNAHDRIKLILGEEYGMEIVSYEGIGTIVKYSLPVMREENRGSVSVTEEEEHV